jgi:hypothetical protein
VTSNDVRSIQNFLKICQKTTVFLDVAQCTFLDTWRDADYLPPSGAEVVNEYGLYILSHPAPSCMCCGAASCFLHS